MIRISGICHSLSTLQNTIGPDNHSSVFNFIDFLKAAGQHVWFMDSLSHNNACHGCSHSDQSDESSIAYALHHPKEWENIRSYAADRNILLFARLQFSAETLPAWNDIIPADGIMLPAVNSSHDSVSFEALFENILQAASFFDGILIEGLCVFTKMDAKALQALKARIKNDIPSLTVLLSDYGLDTPSAKKTANDLGFPVIRYMEKGFTSGKNTDKNIPHHLPQNSVYAFSDNGTSMKEFIYHASPSSVGFAVDYLNLTEREGYEFGLLRGMLGTQSTLVLIPYVDFAPLIESSDHSMEITAKRLLHYTQLYSR